MAKFIKRIFDIKPEHDLLLNKIRNHSASKSVFISKSELVRRALDKYFAKVI